jgi:hypothetical protein
MKLGAESREQRVESREQRAESFGTMQFLAHVALRELFHISTFHISAFK